MTEVTIADVDPSAAEVLRLWHAGEKRSFIAKKLGIPLGTVKSRINRAAKRIAAANENTEGANP